MQLAEVVARQHGVVALWQLRELGFSDDVIWGRVAASRLFGVQREVYALTPTVLPRGRMMAAVLSYGAEAALSHRAAGAIWDLGPWPTGKVDVTVPRSARTRAGTRVHVAQVERAVRDGFPITTVARTLIDLAAVLPLGRLRDAFERAERLRLLDAKEVREEMRGKRGARKVRAILADYTEPEPTRSELERTFRDLCDEYGIPLPSQNVVLLGYEVDALWEADRLVVELDGWEWHRTRRRFEEDRRKAAALDRPTVAAAIRAGCPRAAGRGRAPARAEARPPSAPSA